MYINILLGISLILISAYFIALGFTLRRCSQLVEQASRWNEFRERLFVQAQEEQVEAHRLSVTLQKQYKGLGAPYAEDRDRALAILRRISGNAHAVLRDHNRRPAIAEEMEPYSWKTLLIVPLWSAYRERQEWWEATQALGSRLSVNPSGFSAVRNLEKGLAAKGKQVKAEFETLKDQTRVLVQAFQSEARTPIHFREQIQALAQLDEQIDHTVETHLWGEDVSPKMVARAAPFLDGYRETWDQLNEWLDKSRDIRRDTRSQLEVNQALLDTISGLLESEMQAGRPVNTFRRSLTAEIESLGEQENQRQIGTYLREPALEQRKRFEHDLSVRSQNQRPAYPIPEPFIDALAYMPPCSGNALGLDRLVMLFADTPSIDDVVAFIPEEL